MSSPLPYYMNNGLEQYYSANGYAPPPPGMVTFATQSVFSPNHRYTPRFNSPNNIDMLFPLHYPSNCFCSNRQYYNNYSLPHTYSGYNELTNWPIQNNSGCVAIPATGLLSLDLHYDIHVLMTVDGAFRVYSLQRGIAFSINAMRDITGLIHPAGCVYQRQHDDSIDIVSWDSSYLKRFGKMWKHGVSIGNDLSLSTYLVDKAGTRTTSVSFYDLLYDFTKPIFLNNSRAGSRYIESCKHILDSMTYEKLSNGNRVWIINNIRIVATEVDVKISCGGNIKMKITQDGRTSIDTPHICCTASTGTLKHLNVRKGPKIDKIVHFNGSTFMVKCGSHTAGYNDSNLLTVVK